MPKRYNLVFEQSATFQHTLRWKDPSGTPIDLTGWRIRLQVRPAPESETKYVDFDSAALVEGQHITTLDETGSFTIRFDPEFTQALTFRRGEYDLTATSPGGLVYRLHEGRAMLSPGVVR